VFLRKVNGTRNETEEAHITLYPNPTSAKFTVDLGNFYTEALITITRYDGEIIRKESVKNQQKVEFDLDEPPGIYILNIQTDDKEVVFKVIKD